MNNAHPPYFSSWSEKLVYQTGRVSRIEELWSTHLVTSCQSEFFSKISIWWLTTRWTSSTGTWLTPRASRTPLPNTQTCLCWAPTLLPILIRLTTWRRWWTTRDWEESEQFPNLTPQVILELGAMRSQLYFRKSQWLQERKKHILAYATIQTVKSISCRISSMRRSKQITTFSTTSSQYLIHAASIVNNFVFQEALALFKDNYMHFGGMDWNASIMLASSHWIFNTKRNEFLNLP